MITCTRDHDFNLVCPGVFTPTLAMLLGSDAPVPARPIIRDLVLRFVHETGRYIIRMDAIMAL